MDTTMSEVSENAKASSPAQKTKEQVLKSEKKPHILVAVTGCLAASQLADLCLCFTDWADVICVATKTSLKFIDRASLPSNVKLFTDEDQWSTINRIPFNKVLHNELIKWADVMVIAPLSVNSLTKIAVGLCDNLVTCIVREWNHMKPLYIAPAMNTVMWANPCTQKHLGAVRTMGILLIEPVIVGYQEEALMAGIEIISLRVKTFLERQEQLTMHAK